MWSHPERYEIHTDATFSKASDIYQLGIAICQVLNNYSMFDWQSILKEERFKFLNTDIDSDRRETLSLWKQHPEQWSAVENIQDHTMQKLVLKMVNPNPKKRPTIEQVILFLEQKNRNSG
jgi:serine/threonine protein kinase